MNYQMLRRNPAFQRDMQRMNSLEPWSDSSQSAGDIAGAHAARLGRTEVAGLRHQNKLDAENQRLDLGQRELGFKVNTERQRLGLKRNAFSAGKSQNRAANRIGIANIGLQGMAGILRIQDANQRTKLINEQAQMYRDAGDKEGYYNTVFMSNLLGGE